MQINICGQKVEPLSFLLVILAVWCFMTFTALVLLGWTAVELGIAGFNLPSRVLRRKGRG